jgi:NadR type nicotinamide-nucleotide adenylyltransferase
MTPHGLVIGKFYPPHDGHHLLVRTAAAASERVTVLVLAHEVESIPLADRVAWMREVHAAEPHVTVHGVVDDHPVDFEDPDVWDLHMAEFRRGVAEVTDEPVTAVFTSEPYGPELARRLGAMDVPVDPSRGLAPISGTAVRADPVGSWERVAPPVRGWLARRVVVVGAESTGTTTVSLALVDALRARGGSHGLTRWVPEHGRDFTIEKLAFDRARAIVAGERPPAMDELEWRSDEFAVIAARQNALEDEAARLGGPVLVCDTDAFATGIWHERYMGGPDAATDALARHHPLYLLTHHDGVPFEQDGIRDGESIREWMTERFLEALAATGRRAVVLRGPLERRVADGLAAIDELLAEGWGLADPVTPANSSPSL